ncbi:MAG: lipid-A-disaccharide synthase [Candidatus Margulisbacteria bacterium GWF2_35_9]|nr:MAG: lipid-A-disaccharide synthase [Candidatus Margulisbacteria bacterium GWF2_35_9]
MSEPIKRLLVLTGEVSGDLHASFLIKAIKKQIPDVLIYAVGSEKLQKEGAVIIADISKKSTIGFLEALTVIPTLLKLRKKIITLFNKIKIDRVICVDYQGFNMIMAKEAKRRNIPIAYYILPQEWVWGSEKGMNKVVATADKMVAIFKDEYKSYKKYTDDVVYYGHPLVDIIKQYKENQVNKIRPKQKLISIFPGSRKQEIKYVFPSMIKIMKYLIDIDKKYQFVINLPNKQFLNKITQILSEAKLDIPIRFSQTYETLEESEFAIVTSGTICLETTILETPHVILYRFNRLSFPLIKRALKKFKYKYFSLTNILAGKEIAKEYLQNYREKDVAVHINELFKEKSGLNKVKKDLKIASEKLTNGKSTEIIDSVASYILN